MFQVTEYDPEPGMRLEALQLAQKHLAQGGWSARDITECAEVFLEFIRTGKSPEREGTGGFAPEVAAA